MDPAIPAHTDIKVRVPGTEIALPAFATPPVLSAARLSIRGLVLEQRLSFS